MSGLTGQLNRYGAIAPALLCVLFLCACSSGGSRFKTSTAGKEPQIRVVLAEGQSTYDIVASRGVIVRTEEGLALYDLDAGGTISVVTGGARHLTVSLPDERRGSVGASTTIEPKSGSVLSLDGKRYAGAIRVERGFDGVIRALNVLSLETYLEGVVPYEIGNPGADGFDAVKTQAVAARTYAFRKLDERRDQPFDVYASVLDQVYNGIDGATKVATSAVRDTRGRILEKDGDLVRAYYSACCGGHTSDIRLVWPHREPASYLYGSPDRIGSGRAFCRDYRRFRWRYSFSGRELGAILRKTVPEELGVSPERVGALVDMRVEERSPSGRVIKLRIETTKDDFVVISDRIRWVLMPEPDAGRILPSVMFRLDKMVEGDRIAFISIVGGGNGHGVGMCQNGAIAMAKKGYTYAMILGHYYPGSVIEKVY